ncbi:MAG: ABC transporter permease [Prochlorococcus sp. MED-G132]|uniref:Conserved membrane protein, multidrug efflux associated n=1 Tax=Prochlorococcus marinus (strain MIT 9303) TaxID=59922 RepID=A2CDT0_PROM3|nr:ABC-2 family transporter protein [Prochlorococcus marinus]ABM79640.1 conserved membrane protein, multidrug efflux associated [Prochlorococcus marinus str. MIT 9303]MEC9030238.1 ABC-2 family transporter protein [Cyanobacteriota bacterium]RZO52378.1 MAG: ABC transporter permease [Prochlorococcus sp. MED-G132]
MGRYLLSLKRFWGTALAGQLEYQVNMLIDLVAMVGSLAGSIFVLSVFFGQGRELGGWSWEAALVVQGIYTFLDGVSSTWLRPNLGAIVTHVREGTLDFVLLKPIDSQFWVSLRIMAPAGLPEMGLGLVLIVWAASRAGASFSLGTVLVAVLMLCVGGVILYALWFVIAATSIWFVKTWNATEVLRAVLASGRFPVSAYPPTLRLVFTLVLPVAFLTTVPAEVILGRAAMPMLALGLFLAVIFFVGSRAFWLFALRYYTSASS